MLTVAFPYLNFKRKAPLCLIVSRLITMALILCFRFWRIWSMELAPATLLRLMMQQIFHQETLPECSNFTGTNDKYEQTRQELGLD